MDEVERIKRGLENDAADNPIGRYGILGYHAIADMPRPVSVAERALGVRWPEFDEICKFYLGQFVLVTGIAGHGKSTFLFNIVLRMALIHGIKSVMYVPENETNLYENLRRIFLSGREEDNTAREMFDRLAGNSLFCMSSLPQSYSDEPKTLPWVLDQAWKAVDRDKAELVIIDPWNELERAKPRDQLLTDYIGECLMYLKQFTRAMNVVTILVAHPTKSGSQGGTVTSLAEVEGSMNWFNKCDNGLIVARENGKGAKVVSAKVREIGAGRVGECYFTVNTRTGLFTPVYGGVDLGK